jgi:hypothetical protein
MKAGFNRAGFEATFNKSLRKLGAAERVTKELLRELSRSVLEAHHATENVGYINTLISTLTPINRKTAILFFKEFSGFKWSEETLTFSNKDKKRYEGKCAMSDRFLQDPNNNIWSWAERHVEVEKKPAAFLCDMIKERAKAWHERAKKEHISDADLLVAFFSGGIDPSAVVQALDKLGYELDVSATPQTEVGEAPF